MSAQYSVIYGLATGGIGVLDAATLNLGGWYSSGSASMQTMLRTAIHAAMATWLMDNIGIPLGVGNTATRYIYLPVAAGAANAVFGNAIANFVSKNDGGSQDLTTFLSEAISAALGVWVFARAV
jgi:hypothetical protein